MNILMAVIGLIDLKRAPECIKMHHFEGENSKIFLGREHSPLPRLHPHWGGDTPSPDLTPVDAFGASVQGAFGTRPPRPHFWIRAWGGERGEGEKG